MAGRFYRIEDNSEDITTSPEIISDSKYYDDPRNMYPTSEESHPPSYSGNSSYPNEKANFNSDYAIDDGNTSTSNYLNEKSPMNNTSYSEAMGYPNEKGKTSAMNGARDMYPIHESEDTNPRGDPRNMYPIEEYQNAYSPNTMRNVYSPRTQRTRSVYSIEDHRRMSYTTRKPLPAPSPSPSPAQFQSYAFTPEQPLINNYFETPRASTTNSAGNPFTEPSGKSRKSLLTRSVSSLLSKARGVHVLQASTPLFAAPWRHEPGNDISGNNTIRFFNRKKQQNRIFFHFFMQWLIPVAFCAALVGTLKFYSSKDKLTTREKYMFNALVLGFGLCLGFTVAKGMKEYANILRWRLLAGRQRSLQQFELLMGIASQKKALRFLWVGRTEGSILPNGTQVLCFCYLVIMLGLQIAIASLGLCYSVDAADPGKINFERGNVSIANLKYIKEADNVAVSDLDQFFVQSGAVNSYGIAGQRYGVIYVTTDDTSPDTSVGLPLYTDNSTYWAYDFVDRSAKINSTLSYFAYRDVTAEATCYEYTITSGGFINDGNVTFVDTDGRDAYWPYFGSETAGTTTYYANQDISCGDRCTQVYVLNVGLGGGDEPVYRPQFFQCNNTISAVSNTTGLTDAQAYELPDEQARLIAGAIGYNGANYKNNDIPFQEHNYDVSSLWSWYRMNGVSWSESDVANLVMRFSIGAVASMDNDGPRSFVTGITPVEAQQVNVLWDWAIIILLVVPGIQFLILITTVIWGNRAVVRDDSFLASASLLRPVVEKLERSGCALTSDEICEVLGNPSLAYGVRMPEGSSAYGGMAKGNDELMHLDVIFEEENIKTNEFGWRIGMTMPQGRYDGLKRE